MHRPTSQVIADQPTIWAERRDADAKAPLTTRRLSWRAMRDPLFTLAAVTTILACVFGIGPFERPEGSHQTFLSSPSPR